MRFSASATCLILAQIISTCQVDSFNQEKTQIQTHFENEEWKEVLSHIAREFGYSLIVGQSGFPEGTLTFQDSGEHDFRHVINQLNMQLSILDPYHVLVRKDMQLAILSRFELDNRMLENIQPAQLDNYGHFEVVVCAFDLSSIGVNRQRLVGELLSNTDSVHQSGFSYFESAGILWIRECAGKLRQYNRLIEMAADSGTDETPILNAGFEVHEIGDQDPRTVFIAIESHLNGRSDVKLSQDPASGDILLEANPPTHQAVQGIIEKIGNRQPIRAFELQHIHATEAIEKLKYLLEQNESTGNAALLAEQENRLVAHGSFQTLQLIAATLELIDVQRPAPGLNRHSSRYIMADSDGLEKVWKILHDPQFQRTMQNPVRAKLILHDQRTDYRSRKKTGKR